MSSVGLSMRESPRRRARRDRRRSRNAAVVTIVLVLVLLLAGFFLGRGAIDFLRGGPSPDYTGAGFGEVVFELSPGSLSSVGRELALKGVVASAGAFIDAAEADPRSTSIQPGWYRLRQQMSAREALTVMLDPASRAEHKVTVPEGLRLGETLAVVAKGTGLSKESLEAAAKAGDANLPGFAKGRVEGFLFPATYDIAPNATPGDVLRQMSARFNEVGERFNLTKAREGFAAYELVTIASLIEAEASRDEDFGKVARVIYNRLEINRELQFDSTINYALNAKKAIVLNKDLQVKSPYNTYKFKGLPPGPINSPGEKALAAAIDPAEGNWIYFVTTNLKTGETKFTASDTEFAKFKAELKRNRDG